MRADATASSLLADGAGGGCVAGGEAGSAVEETGRSQSRLVEGEGGSETAPARRPAEAPAAEAPAAAASEVTAVSPQGTSLASPLELGSAVLAVPLRSVLGGEEEMSATGHALASEPSRSDGIGATAPMPRVEPPSREASLSSCSALHQPPPMALHQPQMPLRLSAATDVGGAEESEQDDDCALEQRSRQRATLREAVLASAGLVRSGPASDMSDTSPDLPDPLDSSRSRLCCREVAITCSPFGPAQQGDVGLAQERGPQKSQFARCFPAKAHSLRQQSAGAPSAACESAQTSSRAGPTLLHQPQEVGQQLPRHPSGRAPGFLQPRMDGLGSTEDAPQVCTSSPSSTPRCTGSLGGVGSLGANDFSAISGEATQGFRSPTMEFKQQLDAHGDCAETSLPGTGALSSGAGRADPGKSAAFQQVMLPSMGAGEPSSMSGALADLDDIDDMFGDTDEAPRVAIASGNVKASFNDTDEVAMALPQMGKRLCVTARDPNEGRREVSIGLRGMRLLEVPQQGSR